MALPDLLERLRGTASTASTAAPSRTSTPPPLRIKAKVPAVLGDQATGWCMPCVPTPATATASPSCRRSARASGSSSRAATSRSRSGPAATGTTASCRAAQRPTSRRSSPRASNRSSSTTSEHTITITDQNEQHGDPRPRRHHPLRGGGKLVDHRRQGQRQRRRAGGDLMASHFLTVTTTDVPARRHGDVVDLEHQRSRPRTTSCCASTDTFTIAGCPFTIANVAAPVRHRAVGRPRRAPHRRRRPVADRGQRRPVPRRRRRRQGVVRSRRRSRAAGPRVAWS